jgi:carbamoyl-phosphate synthase large subunit
MAKELKVVGLMNVQYAVDKEGLIYILEVNPRASRTVPFVSKAMGIPWAKIAAKLMAGRTIAELGIKEAPPKPYSAVKACVFPFKRFEGVDTILGPEMKSTGEVMGIHSDFAGGFAKAQFAASNILPAKGTVFLSVMDQEKDELPDVAKKLVELGFSLVATSGTAKYLRDRGFKVDVINKVREGSPHIVDLLGEGKVDLVINTPEGSAPLLDSRSIRLVANELNIPTFTTMAAASAVAQAISIVQKHRFLQVCALQDYHALT